MKTTAAAISTEMPLGRRKAARIAGLAISVLIGAFLTFDAVGKFANPAPVREGMAALGFPVDQALIMGIVLGAVGLTAYLGGAVTAHLRVEAPLLDTTLFAVYLGVLMWIGLALRRPELLKVVGLAR
ncbi:MAG: DoxX family protein [Mycobacterium sp.]